MNQAGQFLAGNRALGSSGNLYTSNQVSELNREGAAFVNGAQKATEFFRQYALNVIQKNAGLLGRRLFGGRGQQGGSGVNVLFGFANASSGPGGSQASAGLFSLSTVPSQSQSQQQERPEVIRSDFFNTNPVEYAKMANIYQQLAPVNQTIIQQIETA